MKQTIMILTNSDSGLYDFRKELLQELIKKGYSVLVSVPGGKYKERIKSLGCEYVQTDFARHGTNPIKELGLLKTYVKLLKEYEPICVLTYTVKPNIYGGMACTICKIPYLANITGLGNTLENGGLVRKVVETLYKTALRKARCVYFQNQHNYEVMSNRKIIKGRYRLIPGSGVNIQEHCYKEYPIENPKINFLSVMRIMRDKGIEELLETIRKTKIQGTSNIHFDLLGNYEPEEESLYRTQIEELESTGLLTYWGYREDSDKFMERAHIIVHPTYHEGLSNVLLEAAATGRMVVTTDIPGCKEIVKDGETGILCKPKVEDALYEAIQKALHLTPEERERMGKEGRQHVEENFDRKKVVDIYMEEIDNTINANLKQKRAK